MSVIDPGDELRHTGYEIFIAALSVLSIANLILSAAIDNEAMTAVVLSVNIVLSLILFIDFLYRFSTAPSRANYFWRNWGWADLLASVPLTQLKVLRIFRLVRVWRLLRVVGARQVARSLVGARAGSALLTLLLVAILMLEFGSLAVLGLESHDPEANIVTASDALWYVIATMSTVGYGDQYPVTQAGRLLGSVIIVVGVGIFGTLTGFLANAFLSDPEQDEADPPAPEDDSGSGSSAALDAQPEPGDPQQQPESGPGSPVPPRAGSGDEPAPGSLGDLQRQLVALRAQQQATLASLERLMAEHGIPPEERR